MDDARFVENYFAMEKWVNDNIPVAGETFREFVKKLYQRNELVKGEFRLRRPAGQAGADHLPAAAVDGRATTTWSAGVDRGDHAARRLEGHQDRWRSMPGTSAWRSAPRPTSSSGPQATAGSPSGQRRPLNCRSPAEGRSKT